MISNYILFENKKLNPDKILKITSKIQYENFTDESKYIVKTPEQVLRKKEAVCYDLVELQRKLFNQIGYEFKTFFAYENLPITDNPTHTFLVFKENNKYYWFESSWQSYKAIHGPFNSYQDTIKYFSKQIKKANKWKNVNIVEYNKFNYRNMNLNEFGQYILNKHNIYPIIKFPKHEWNDYKKRLKNNEIISTTRIYDEFDKYVIGHKYKTEWDDILKVVKVNKLNNIKDHPWYNNMDKNDIKQISKTNKIDHVFLKKEKI
jgi:hypothetical protein